MRLFAVRCAVTRSTLGFSSRSQERSRAVFILTAARLFTILCFFCFFRAVCEQTTVSILLLETRTGDTLALWHTVKNNTHAISADRPANENHLKATWPRRQEVNPKHFTANKRGLRSPVTHRLVTFSQVFMWFMLHLHFSGQKKHFHLGKGEFEHFLDVEKQKRQIWVCRHVVKRSSCHHH